MGFTTTELDDDYKYDFTAHNGPSGSIPMPTTEDVRKFRESFYAEMDAITGIPSDSVDTDERREQRSKRIDAMTPEERDRSFAGSKQAVVELCKGSPAAEVLDALPYPVQAAFVHYVGSLLVPLF